MNPEWDNHSGVEDQDWRQACQAWKKQAKLVMEKRDSPEAEVKRLRELLDDAHVQNARDQDEHSEQRAKLQAEVVRLREAKSELELGLGHIASALGLSEWDPHDALNRIAQRRDEIERLRQENNRLRAYRDTVAVIADGNMLPVKRWSWLRKRHPDMPEVQRMGQATPKGGW